MARPDNSARVQEVEKARQSVATAMPTIEKETQRLGYLAQAVELLMGAERKIDA